MIVNMQAGATDEQIDHVIERVKECGFQAHVIRGAERTIIGCVGSGGRRTELEALLAAPGVEALVPIAHPFKLVSRQLRAKPSEIVVRGIAIGGGRPVVIAGPCSVESREQILETARAVRAAGADMLRGGAYKPRTSPYDFQGLGQEALDLLVEAREETGLPIVTEVMSTEDVDAVSDAADILQVGARNMQNFPLLRRLARARQPSDSAKARPIRHRERMAASRRISSRWWQSKRNSLRARHKNFRERAAKHFRHSRDRASQRINASPSSSRSLSRHRPPQPHSSNEPRSPGRRRRRPNDRGPSMPRARPFRWPAIHGPARFRQHDGRHPTGKSAEACAPVVVLFVGAPLAAPAVSEANERPNPTPQK
jgi:hypothetical protein